MKEKTKQMKKESLIDKLEKEMDMSERYLIGTDEYVQHTMRMTLGNQYKILDVQVKKSLIKTLKNLRMKVKQ